MRSLEHPLVFHDQFARKDPKTRVSTRRDGEVRPQFASTRNGPAVAQQVRRSVALAFRLLKHSWYGERRSRESILPA